MHAHGNQGLTYYRDDSRLEKAVLALEINTVYCVCGLGVCELLSTCRKAGCRDFTDITYVLVPTHGLAGAREYMRVCILSIIYICKHLKIKAILLLVRLQL